MLMNKQYMLNKVSLNTHKQGYVVWSVDENIVTRVLQEPNYIYSLGAVFQYSLIRCSQWLDGT